MYNPQFVYIRLIVCVIQELQNVGGIDTFENDRFVCFTFRAVNSRRRDTLFLLQVLKREQ